MTPTHSVHEVPWTLPNCLSVLRLALAPLLLALAWLGRAELFVPVLVLSLATDMADGFLARRLGQETRLGTLLDSRADLATYAVLPLAAWWLRPDFVLSHLGLFALLLASFALPTLLGWLRFGRLTSYHTWGAKASAVAVGAALIALFAGGPTWPLQLAAVLVVLEALEEIAISAVLPRWECNVPTLVHALQLRRSERPDAGGRPI